MISSKIIKALMNKLSNNIRVSMPGKIEKYDFNTQKANIKINMHELLENETSIDYPVLTSVPIIFPSSGGASITMPIKRNDSCIVFFTDRDITNWLLGASNQPPQTRRVHSLNDAVAIMGLKPFNKNSAATNNTDLLIQYNQSKICLKPNGIIEIHASTKIDIKTNNIEINCNQANIQAKESIQINTPNIIQKGNIIIDGNIEVRGTSKLKGNVTSDAILEGKIITTKSGIDLENHKHPYNEAQVGSNPTATTPSQTGQGI